VHLRKIICLSVAAAAILVSTSNFAQAVASVPLKSTLQRAEELEDSGQFAQAEQIYLVQEKQFPKNAKILFHLGALHMRQLDWPKAVAHLERCRSLQPRNVDALFYLAQAHYFNGELGSAQRTLLVAARLAPNDGTVLQKLGEYLCEGDEYAQGLDYLLKARKLDPKLENLDVDLGMAFHKLTKIQEAQPFLELAFRKDPNNLVAVRLLGEIAAYQGDWDKARNLYEYVLSRESRNAAALVGLGTTLVALGKEDEALSPLRESPEIDPGMTDAYFQLGKALRKLGRSEEALHEMELFQSIRDRDHIMSTFVSASRALQGEYWKTCEKLLKENKESEAIDYMNSVAADAHVKVNVLYLVGTLYYVLQRNEDAIRMLNQAGQMSPNDADIVAFLGRVYLSESDYPQSEFTLNRALEIRPQDQLALVSMGELRYANAQWTEAARYFDESRAKDVPTLLLMCDAYKRAGNLQRAHESAELVRVFAHGDAKALTEVNSIMGGDGAVEPILPAHPR
jgi:tetratricopeptide (TPR) repeat protein